MSEVPDADLQSCLLGLTSPKRLQARGAMADGSSEDRPWLDAAEASAESAGERRSRGCFLGEPGGFAAAALPPADQWEVGPGGS